MNCFVILRKDGSFTRIEDAPQNECDFFMVALEKVQSLISIHSMFDYVRMAYERIQEIRSEFEQCEQRMDKPLSPQKTMLAEKACRDYLYHYMAYIDNLNAFVKKAYGRSVPLTKKIEAQLKRMERIPECSFVHSLRNYVTHKGNVLSFVTKTSGGIAFLIDRDRLLGEYNKWMERDKKLLADSAVSFDVFPVFTRAYRALYDFHCLLAVDYINNNDLGRYVYFMKLTEDNLKKYLIDEEDEYYFADAHDETGKSVTEEAFLSGQATGFIFRILNWEIVRELAAFIQVEE